MTEQDNVYNCDDSDLGAMLHRLLIVEGHDEAVVQHPTDGEIIVTKADYKKHLANINRVKNMSPADRVTENKRLRNIKNQMQIRFRTSMISAPVHIVDIDDESGFGKDIEGNQLDIEGMIFLPVKDYPKGLELKENEIGAFISEFFYKKPIRIKTNSPGRCGANNIYQTSPDSL